MRRAVLVALAVALLVLASGCGSSGGESASSGRGVEFVFEAQAPAGGAVSDEEIDRSVKVMNERLDGLGFEEDRLGSFDGKLSRVFGTQRVVLRLNSVPQDGGKAIADIVGSTGGLAFYDLEPSLVPPSIDASQTAIPFTSLYKLLARVQSGRRGQPAQYWLFDAKTKRLVAGPAHTRAQLERLAGGKRLARSQVMTTPGKRVVVSCSAETAVVCPGLPSYPGAGATYYYLFADDPTGNHPSPAMTGADLKLDGTRQDFDSNGTPIVTFQFTDEGNRGFHRITRDEAVHGRALGLPQHFAIVLDDRIRSFPQIDYQQYPDGINPTGGGAQITGLASLADAKALALVLRNGSLPVDFVLVSSKVVR